MPLLISQRRVATPVLIVCAAIALSCDESPTGPQVAFNLAPSNPILFRGMSIRLDPTPLSSGATPAGPLKWSSSDSGIVSIDATGLIRGISTGTANVRAYADEGYAEMAVQVVEGGGTVRTAVITTCGVTTSDSLYCWGDNSRGQLGTGTVGGSQPSPVKVSGGLSFTSVTLGSEHACGMTPAGPYCWGGSGIEALGDGSRFAIRPAPVKVIGGEVLTSVEANGTFTESAAFCSDATCGNHTCGLTATGRAWCWGGGPFGAPLPQEIPGNFRFLSLSLGFDYTCGIAVDRNALCWGSNGYGQAAGVVPSGVPEPRAVSNTTLFQVVSAGRGHTCSIALDGDAYCWGANPSGQLGAPSDAVCSFRFGTTPCRAAPVKVQGGYKFQAISVGTSTQIITGIKPVSHTCGITIAQDIVCWGENVYGQLGSGVPQSSDTPVKVQSSLKFRSVSAGREHTCAVATDGAGYCWGSNQFGQLGDGTRTDSPVPVRVAGGLTFK